MSPVRLSFSGGGTDMPEYYEKYGGKVISSTINHFTYVITKQRSDNKCQIFSQDFQIHDKPKSIKKMQIRKGNELVLSIMKYLKFNHGINIMITSDIPPRSGLGSSSSLAVNIVNVIKYLQNKKPHKNEIANIAHHVERNILKLPMGIQDEYISIYGGFNLIEFSKDKIKVIPLKFKKNSLKELNNNLLLFYIGSRSNEKILFDQIKKIEKKDKQMYESLDQVKELVDQMYDNLKNNDFTKFGEILHKGWNAKKKFSNKVSNKKVDKNNKKDLSLSFIQKPI